MTPNKVNIRKWVNALRSGEFKQATDLLARNVNGELNFCCLGVACETALTNGVEMTVEVDDFSKTYDHHGSLLPHAVIEWLGLSDKPTVAWESVPDEVERYMSGYGTHVSLNSLNDRANATFEQIADAIEKEYLDA